MDGVASTCRYVAAARARESERRDALFVDPFAASLAGPEGRALLARMEPAALNPYLTIRTRFFDDFVMREASSRGQLVILAAGMDARALRLDLPPHMVAYEVDRSDVLDLKESVLREHGAKPRVQRRVVRADLTRDWASPLAEAGFVRDSASVFLVEGLLAYLEPAQAHRLLSEISLAAAPESALGADLPGESFFTSPFTRDALARASAIGAPWKFGSDAPEELFGSHGFEAAVTRPGEPGADFGRWPFPVLPRATPGAPNSYLVQAVRRTVLQGRALEPRAPRPSRGS
jgi:methyltransferase (TIGR00027 family)